MANIDAQSPSETNVGALLKSVGAWNKPTGRGIFMFRTLVAGTTSAALMGVCAAALGGIFLGGGSPFFAIFSCLGYALGTLAYYFTTRQHAYLAFHQFPRLMFFHLRTNFPISLFNTESVDTPVGRSRVLKMCQDSLMREGQLISAWHTAQVSIDEILERREARLITELAEGSTMEGVLAIDEGREDGKVEWREIGSGDR